MPIPERSTPSPPGGAPGAGSSDAADRHATGRRAPDHHATDRPPRWVIVTGASSGIGLACARRFLDAGDRVVAHYHTHRDPVDALALEAGDGRVVPIGADLGAEHGCEAAVAACPGEPQVLVHSAGIWNAGPIDALTGGRLEEMFRVDTFSAYYLAREMVRARRRRDSERPGSIILIGSTAGERGEPGHSHYAGAKAALWGLVQSLAQELAPAVRVNLVSPGWVRTPMAAAALAEAGREQRIVAGVPMRRIADADDIAAAALYLADDAAARHVTGIDLAVSGGALLPMPRG